MWRFWPDGSCFLTGWGCGMDNQPRLPKGDNINPRFSTGFMSWINITLQQLFVDSLAIEASRDSCVKRCKPNLSF